MSGGGIPATAPVQVAVVDGSCTLTPADIGGKAWGVNRMRALGLPVPPAIVATTHACREYHATDRAVHDALWAQIVEHMKVLEEGTGRRFGGAQRPLLVSVRSGAAQSMPGMMDTVLNLGINAAVEAALAAETGDARYAADTHRRFVEQYRKVVLGDRPEPGTCRSLGPAARRGGCGVRVVALAARPGLSAQPRLVRRGMHRGDDPGDGVRQPRRAFGHRGVVQPQPDHRRRLRRGASG